MKLGRVAVPLRKVVLAAAPAGEVVLVVAAVRSLGAGERVSWRRDGRGA